MSFVAELKRRNVIRVAVLYVVAAWLAMQIADVGMSTLGLPEWTGRFVLLMLAVGFVPTLVFSWVYELTPEGIKRESEVDRSQSVTGETGRKLNIATVVVVILGVGIVLVDRLLPERRRLCRTRSRPSRNPAWRRPPRPARRIPSRCCPS